ncbi:MAG: sugar ABC transporter permease [Lachnospiraceae bacterium]|nr:sugar ABC transporter permease [Lachnospiraceae bacterium]MBQ7780992.1 sugar ABC transporter permease [Lachnospiraceae bacterium]
MRKKNKLTLLQKRGLTGILFVLPWVVGFILFYVRSLIMTGQFAFNELTIDAVNGGYQLTPVGWENFRYAFQVHGSFKQILTSSVGNMLIDVPLIIFFSLFMAMLLNKKFPGRAVVRAIFFLPVILNSGAITEAMELSEQMMAGGISSQAAEVTATVGSTMALDIDYLISMFMNLGIPASLLDYIVAAVDRINDIIAASGIQIVIFIAALQSIPGSMYEVAKIEGATGYETFWKVTFPMVMPHIITNVVYTIVDSFTESEVVTLAYEVAFDQFNYGLSSVFSLVSTIITCIILVLIVGAIQKRTFYYN